MTKWDFCNYCIIDGKCQNQDLNHECEMPVKKLYKQNEKLKKQLWISEQSISSALNYLACMDRISDKECNEQLAFNVLRKALEELEK